MNRYGKILIINLSERYIGVLFTVSKTFLLNLLKIIGWQIVSLKEWSVEMLEYQETEACQKGFFTCPPWCFSPCPRLNKHLFQPSSEKINSISEHTNPHKAILRDYLEPTAKHCRPTCQLSKRRLFLWPLKARNDAQGAASRNSFSDLIPYQGWGRVVAGQLFFSVF